MMNEAGKGIAMRVAYLIEALAHTEGPLANGGRDKTHSKHGAQTVGHKEDNDGVQRRKGQGRCQRRCSVPRKPMEETVEHDRAVYAATRLATLKDSCMGRTGLRGGCVNILISLQRATM